jgi:hypothetical protein
MRICMKVLLIALVFSFAIGILSQSPEFLMRLYPNDNQAIGTTATYFGILATIISPVLFFVTFYFIGKKPETLGEFYSCLLSFFLGNWIGLAFGGFLGTVLSIYDLPSEVVAYILMGSFAGSLFSSSFFVGFSALAVSYIIKKSKKPNNAEAQPEHFSLFCNLYRLFRIHKCFRTEATEPFFHGSGK